jgi:hypothetical protein
LEVVVEVTVRAAVNFVCTSKVAVKGASQYSKSELASNLQFISTLQSKLLHLIEKS